MSEALHPSQLPPETGTARMDHDAQTTILANERAAADQAASEAVDLARQDRIDARYNSLELRDLNDAAEVAIFGETGILASMKENPRYGTKQADREAAAETYKTDVLELVDEGFELTQAKLIMDLRETAEKARADRTKAVRLSATKIMNSSETLDTEAAVARASAFYDKKNTPPLTDEENKALIKEQAIFTNDDYNKVTEGTDLYEEVDEQQNEIAELKKEVADLEDVVLKGVAALAVDETVKSDILKGLDVIPNDVSDEEDRNVQEQQGYFKNQEVVQFNEGRMGLLFKTVGDKLRLGIGSLHKYARDMHTDQAGGNKVIVSTESGALYGIANGVVVGPDKKVAAQFSGEPIDVTIGESVQLPGMEKPERVRNVLLQYKTGQRNDPMVDTQASTPSPFLELEQIVAEHYSSLEAEQNSSDTK